MVTCTTPNIQPGRVLEFVVSSSDTKPTSWIHHGETMPIVQGSTCIELGETTKTYMWEAKTSSWKLL